MSSRQSDALLKRVQTAMGVEEQVVGKLGANTQVIRTRMRSGSIIDVHSHASAGTATSLSTAGSVEHISRTGVMKKHSGPDRSQANVRDTYKTVVASPSLSSVGRLETIDEEYTGASKPSTFDGAVPTATLGSPATKA
ncbi:hypothetical protein [Aliikangiella sp. IMCC44359]|uniref:hypothetical protein n=1 Tax=Aliikangiella sp. IMCC44359 TaxID=3459125 RepID=UPI00403AC320